MPKIAVQVQAIMVYVKNANAYVEQYSTITPNMQPEKEQQVRMRGVETIIGGSNG